LQISSIAGSYTIAGLAAEDFPNLPEVGETQATKLPGPALQQAISSTIFAASNDEAKQLLCGVNFTITGQIEAAATNGHRLARSIVPIDELAPGFRQQACIPTRALRELARIIGEENVLMDIGTAYLSASTGSTTLYSRVLTGTYPDYEKLLPTVFEHGITANRKALLEAVRRVALVADTHNSVVKLTADSAVGQMVISAETEAGSAVEQIAATVIGSPTAAFNAGYLIDGLAAMHTDEVCLQLNSPTTPVILSPVGAEDSYTYLVMPVQVRQASSAGAAS
jgi:DNA polymerase III subunit beta